jgi:hypothetical protein
LSETPPSSFPPPGAKPLWGSPTSGAAAPSPSIAPVDGAPAAPRSARSSLLEPMGFGSEPLDPLERRLMHGVRFLSLLLLLVVANSFLNNAESPLQLNPIAAAAERTQNQPGARTSLKAIYTSAALPHPLVGHGGGAYNSGTGRTRATISVNGVDGKRVTVETIGDGTSIYLRGNAIESELPPGKEWLQLQPLLGHNESEAMLGGGDADSSLQMLGVVSGNVGELGREKVRGVATRRYRAVVEFSDYADALREEGKDEIADQYDKYAAISTSSPTVEAWVDGKGILRRCRMVMAIPTQPGQPTLTMDMRMEFFDFGARPRIALPDPARVYDATPLLEAQLDAAAG